MNQPSGSQSETRMSKICFPLGEKLLRAKAEANKGTGKRSSRKTVLLSRGLRLSDSGKAEGYDSVLEWVAGNSVLTRRSLDPQPLA